MSTFIRRVALAAKESSQATGSRFAMPPGGGWRGTGPRSSSRSGPAGSRSRWPPAACRSMASSSRRRWSPGCAPSPAPTRSRHDRRHGHDAGRRLVPPRLSRVQHDRQPDDPGRTGRVLPQRRGAPRAGRALRDRGRRPGACNGCPGETVLPFERQRGRQLGFDEYDIANQGLISHHLELVDGRRDPQLGSRSATPRQPRVRPDGAARGALSLQERWSGLGAREPFHEPTSSKHVSVWARDA